MDLIANSTFRILQEKKPSTHFSPGIYRVILDEPSIERTVTVLIQPETKAKTRKRVGRYPIDDKKLRRPRKKPPAPLVGNLIWMDRNELNSLFNRNLLKLIDVERHTAPELRECSKTDYELRKRAMAGFLDLKNLQESIVVHTGMGGLVKDAVAAAGVSRPFVYKQWSLLCRWGMDEKSLMPGRDRCGAPGVARPCNVRADGQKRKKAGRKTLDQRVALAYGIKLEPEQPGMSVEWACAVRAADKLIPTPKPSWPERCKQILLSHFCANAKEEDGKLVLVKPPLGQYPNSQQIKRVLTVDKTRLERILEQTTKRHFESALRGLIARNWQGVAGPNHTWAIDSTVGDIYLRSSVNRAWIVGRPIVYVIVDIWSTAVVGFYVCLTGPSWDTAKVSLFNAASDPALVADLWGYELMMCLNPAPTLCYSLLCDRGEYLSQGHRTTALKLELPLTSYAPPYRGDLKGLAEVLHRIEKDKQFLFIPGAMDFRRKELELRRVDPKKCVYTVREYVHYLYELFSEYNLTADRSHRVDAHMRAAGVFPSPAGLWQWGHQMGIAFRRHIAQPDLIQTLLPTGVGRVRRDAVCHAGNDYMSAEIKAAQWTAIARNLGGWDVPINYYPGAMRSIWTPVTDGAGLWQLTIADESQASPELTMDEWLDVAAVATMERRSEDHQRTWNSMDSLQRVIALRDNARRLTAEAVAKASGTAPTMSEARVIELAATTHPSGSEAKVAEELRDEAMQNHQEMIAAMLRAANFPKAADDPH